MKMGTRNSAKVAFMQRQGIAGRRARVTFKLHFVSNAPTVTNIVIKQIVAFSSINLHHFAQLQTPFLCARFPVYQIIVPLKPRSRYTNRIYKPHRYQPTKPLAKEASMNTSQDKKAE